MVLAITAEAGVHSYWLNGRRYYALYSVCQDNEIKYCWDSSARVATLIKNGVEAKIRVGSDKLLVGERLKDIGPPLLFHDNTVVIPASFAKSKLNRVFGSKVTKKFAKTAKTAKHRIRTIVIDPGHGGKDPGAVGKYYKLHEKDIALDVAKRLKKLLTSRGIKVYMTRQNDKFISLWKRADIANKKNADLFVSVHANSSRYRSAKGFETYYFSQASDDSAKALEAAENAALDFDSDSLDKYNKNAKAIAYDMALTENKRVSRDIAEYVTKYVRRKIYVRDRGLKSARFWVLKATYMPAVLVEIGFISNKKEEGLLRTASHRQRIAEGLAKGILTYKNEYEKENGFSR